MSLVELNFCQIRRKKLWIILIQNPKQIAYLLDLQTFEEAEIFIVLVCECKPLPEGAFGTIVYVFAKRALLQACSALFWSAEVTRNLAAVLSIRIYISRRDTKDRRWNGVDWSIFIKHNLGVTDAGLEAPDVPKKPEKNRMSMELQS